MSNNRFTNQVSYGLFDAQSYSEASKGSSKTIKQDFTTLGRGMFDSRAFTDSQVRNLIRKSDRAYYQEGLVKQAVDIYTEQFKGILLKGNERAVKYLHQRLNMISLRVGEPWQELVARTVLEYFKVGTSFIVKHRGVETMASRSLYRNAPIPISYIQIVPANRLEPMRKVGNKVIGWRDIVGSLRSKDVQDPTGTIADNQALIEIDYDPEYTQSFLIPGMDMCKISFKAPAEGAYGIGLTFAGLGDIELLRNAEGNVSNLIKKYSIPPIHHTIAKPKGLNQNNRAQFMEVESIWRNAADTGIIISSENHSIKAVGAESAAVRCEGYLHHDTMRVCSSLGASPGLLGFESQNLGAAEADKNKLKDKSRYCQAEIARQWEFGLLWELLYEGGFNPYLNEEDRVELEFVELDEDRAIKLQTHAFDAYTKNAVDLDQAYEIAKGNFHGAFNRPPKDSKTMVQKVQIPHKKAAPPKQKETSLSTRESIFKQQILRILPSEVEDGEEFELLLNRLYSVEPEKARLCREAFESLFKEDDDALFLSIYSIVHRSSEEIDN